MKLDAANRKFGAAIQGALRDDTEFGSEIAKIALPDHKGTLSTAEIASTLHLSQIAVTAALLDRPNLGIVHYALQVIDEWCAARLMAFIVESSRSELSDIDPSALAFTMQVLHDSDAPRHIFGIQQGLSILSRLQKFGQFPAGQAFHSDEKGRSLFVPSIEVANVVLRLFLEHYSGLRDVTLFDEIVALTHAVHVRLNEQIVAMGRSDGVQGWCTDRAPSKSRIDSWVTTQVLEFFVGRIALLCAMKRRLVLENYSWHSALNNVKAAPRWDKLADPNEGTGVSLLKKEISRVADNRTKTQAPIFLLYGPPGTAKTTIAKSFASLKQWDIVFLSPSDFVADSADRIEMRSREIFVDIMNLNNTVILLDEMDSLFVDRGRPQPTPVMEFVVPAFLTKLQDLRDYTTKRNIAVFINTNFYEKIDRGIRRPGRIDNHLLVLPYSRAAQVEVVRDLAEKRGMAGTDPIRNRISEVLQLLPCNFGFRDIERLVASAIETPTASVEDLCRMMQHSGVQPEEYDFKLREGAYAEFVDFARRLTGDDMSGVPPVVGSARDAALELGRIARGIKGKNSLSRDLHSQWESAINEWARSLSAKV
jgi:ATPase family associated with various cellular activities (AAA)